MRDCKQLFTNKNGKLIYINNSILTEEERIEILTEYSHLLSPSEKQKILLDKVVFSVNPNDIKKF